MKFFDGQTRGEHGLDSYHLDLALCTYFERGKTLAWPEMSTAYVCRLLIAFFFLSLCAPFMS